MKTEVKSILECDHRVLMWPSPGIYDDVWCVRCDCMRTVRDREGNVFKAVCLGDSHTKVNITGQKFCFQRNYTQENELIEKVAGHIKRHPTHTVALYYGAEEYKKVNASDLSTV